MINQFKEQAQKIAEDFYNEILSYRTSRPNPVLVENIKVDCYGAQSPLKNIASISIFPPNGIVIEPWDQNLISFIKKAIDASPLGLNAVVDAKQVKLFLPTLDKEKKEELKKAIGIKKEEFRIKLRKLRELFLEDLKDKFDKKEISEDEKFRLKEEVQRIIEEINETFDKHEEKKIKEIEES